MPRAADYGFPRLPLCFDARLLARTRVVVLPVARRGWVLPFGAPRFVGITLRGTYFLARSVAEDEAVHFHELVHVVQWRALGSARFLARYLREHLARGYDGNALERMAYDLEQRFLAGETFDAEAEVRRRLAAAAP